MVISTIPASNCTPQTIVIGRRGTYDTMQIVFDLNYLIDTYGNGVAVLAVKRSQDESAYPAVVTQENATLTWTVSETDTAYVGSGECQLMWYVNGGLAKTIIYPMVVMRDILQTAEEPPDGYENWIEHLTELGAETQQNAQNAAQSASEAEQAKDDAVDAKEASEEAARKAAAASVHAPIIQNGFWYIWSDDQYVNTNVRAEGEKGDKGDTGEKGDTGNGIASITKTGTSGLVDTYTVTYTDGTSTTFTVTNGAKGDKGDTGATGNGIASIAKTGTSGNVDTYTITYTNGQTVTFTVTNGAVSSVAGKTGAVVLDSGDIEYDSTEIYQSGTVGAELSDLSRQISDVESDLTEISTNTGIEHNITDEFSFTNGYAVWYSEGTLGSSGVQSCSNFVPIPSGYDHIILTTVIRPDNVGFGTAFYSTASTSGYISGTQNTVDTTKTLLDSEISVFTIPQNAKYIRTSWIATTYSTYSSHTFYCALVKTGELEVTQQKVEYIEPTDVDGFIHITKDEMESGSFVSGYTPNGNRCRNKNHYIKARKGDIVVGHRKTADIVMAVIDNSNATSTLYTSGWRTSDFALATPYDGYYVLLGKTALADFDSDFTIYPAKQFFKALPERYYLDEIATTLASITDKQTEPCLCFPLITDIHYGATATSIHPYLFHKTYRNLLKVIQEKRSDAIVCLGDVTDGNFTKPVGIDFGMRVNGMFKMLPVPYLLTIGNHDDNRYYSAPFDASDIAKVNTAYISNTVVYNPATNGRDYYIDFPNYKIRLISIDAVDNRSYAYNTDTVTWFTNTALNTPDNYLAVILTHVSPVSSQNYNNTEVTNGTAIVQAIEAYISGGKDAFQLYGHSHCDVSFTSPYLSIATCFSKYTNENGDPTKWPSGATMPTRTEYTATEDCWDYVIIRPQSKKVNLVRFGAGDDREFTYGTV